MYKIRERKGFAMTEMLIAVICSLFIITVTFTLYSSAKQQQSSAELVRTLSNSVNNIRTFYAFDGKYDAIINVKGQDFYDKEFLSHAWKCPNDKTTCAGPDGVTVTFSCTKTGGACNSFTMTLAKVPAQSCIALAENNWRNIDEVKINSTTFSGKNVPVTAKNATAQCKKSDNTMTFTLE